MIYHFFLRSGDLANFCFGLGHPGRVDRLQERQTDGRRRQHKLNARRRYLEQVVGIAFQPRPHMIAKLPYGLELEECPVSDIDIRRLELLGQELFDTCRLLYGTDYEQGGF